MKAPHKQSGDINNPENFENHKKNSLDRVDGRKISIWNEKKVYKMYQPYFEFLKKNREEFPEELLEKYQFSLIF
jgi:hypothetical protein